MSLLDEVFLLLREHEVKLTASLLIPQRVHKQVQIVNFVDLLDKSVNLAQEVGRVHIVDQVDIELVLAQQLECFAVAGALDETDGGLEQHDPWLDTFKVASGHLEDCLVTIAYYDPRATLHCPHIKVTSLVQLSQLRRLVLCVEPDIWSWQLFV